MATKAANSSHTTTDHATIKRWVETRNGKPAAIRGTNNQGKDEAELLRINFPGGAEDSFPEITWDEFFERFEESKLAFMYQDEKQSGEYSYVNKFVHREEK